MVDENDNGVMDRAPALEMVKGVMDQHKAAAIGGGIGAAVGAALGGPIGAAIGGGLGGLIGGWLEKGE